MSYITNYYPVLINTYRTKETQNEIESISNDCQIIKNLVLFRYWIIGRTSDKLVIVHWKQLISPTQSTGTGTYYTDNLHADMPLEPTLIITNTKYKTTNEQYNTNTNYRYFDYFYWETIGLN